MNDEWCSGDAAVVRDLPRMCRGGVALLSVTFLIGSLSMTAAAARAEREPFARPANILAAQLSEPTADGKRINATRSDSPPVLDGLVDDAVWQTADVVGDFLQREPQEGDQPSERTEVRILYDEENLYFGLVLYDSDPAAIRATQARRDSLRLRAPGQRGGDLSDDFVSVLLDTFHDHRNAFVFTVNPLGTRSDATVRNEREVNQDWDERWEAAARITERGWEAELLIPWSILRYASSNSTWGVDFRRQIRRKNEEVIWNNYSQDYPFVAVSQAGHLVGLENLELAERFRFKPYVIGSFNSLQQQLDPVSEGTADFGIEDFKIKLTSNLTSQLTYNTDFAQVEVDEQRVNLTRFSLFFPEKREFFLEAANNFSFGNTRGRFRSLNPPPSRLFFSRRIGLADDGTPLPIDFGGKLTGKIGRGNLGFLNVQTGDSEFGEGRNYTALRWRQDVLSRSSLGAYFSNVQGPDGDYNRVLGVDANFTFLDHLNLTGFAARSMDDEIEGGAWIGQFQARWESDLWEAEGEMLLVEDGFRSELGFIARTGIVKQTLAGRWKPRPGFSWLRQVDINPYFDRFTNLDGELLTRQAGTFVRFLLESGDSFSVSFRNNFDLLDVGFEVHPTITVPAGDYRFTDWSTGFATYPGRTISGGISLHGGGFFDGNAMRIRPRAAFRLSETFSFAPSYNYNRVKLSGGSFIVHVARLRADVSFSDRWLTDTLAQYNSLTDELSLFARLRYIYRIGDNFYLVYRQSRLFDGSFAGIENRSISAKMTYSFQW